MIPEGQHDEAVVPKKDVEVCVNCGIFMGLYVVLDCGHYSFCKGCLQEEKYNASCQQRGEKCLGCGEVATRYIRAYRSSACNDD